MRHTLAIDFGSRNIGIALVEHAPDALNRVLYAATIVVEAKPLNAAVKDRAMARRIRRTRKTHRMRLRRLSQLLRGIPNAARLVRFCRRRGYGYDPKEQTEQELPVLSVSRADFFAALRREIAEVIPAEHHERVWRSCAQVLNESRRRTAEMRSARFDNRGPSKCQWEGCRHNVARAENAIKIRLQQALYVWLKPVFDVACNKERLRQSVDHWIAELTALATAYRNAQNCEDREAQERCKAIDRRKNRVFKNLLARVQEEGDDELSQHFKQKWDKTYRRNLANIIHQRQSGRVRYCSAHSAQFVEHFLAGKPIPNRTEVFESDLFGRTQQILFRRIWRFVESRLLPLTGGRIERVVVERVAFDVLAGSAAARKKVSEDKAAEMYWYGPQYGFSGRHEMLAQEFGGRCAYCGQKNADIEVEHLLPQSQFPFDSYLNVLPSCRTCNAQKGARTPFAAGMHVHPEAYEAYANYVHGMKTPHLFHTIKKGLLNLLTRPGNHDSLERELGMLANNLVSITHTQRGPRPLARFLASHVAEVTGKRCQAHWTSGRHTALYRSILLPEYSKEAEKDEGGVVNHAIDAIILGCELPSATAIENKRWCANLQDLNQWRSQVLANCPPLSNGLPSLTPLEPIPFFEETLNGSGYCKIDLSAFNWNHSRKSGHKLDPVGKTNAANAVPQRVIKRERATAVLADLNSSAARKKRIANIAHPALRAMLQAKPHQAPEIFVRWLQQTTEAGLATAQMGRHPSAQMRKRILETFVHTPVEAFLANAENKMEIPSVIGVRCLVDAPPSLYDVERYDKNGKACQSFKSDPHFRALYVGYRVRQGQVDRLHPELLWVTQNYTVTHSKSISGKKHPLQVPPDSPLNGRPLNSPLKLKKFLLDWKTAFDNVCKQLEIVKRFHISQGCVIEKMDGSRFQFRNFSKEEPWMKGTPFHNIRRVYRSPLQFLDKQAEQKEVKKR